MCDEIAGAVQAFLAYAAANGYMDGARCAALQAERAAGAKDLARSDTVGAGVAAVMLP